MANTYTLIASNTLGSSAASVTFSSIPSTYTDFVLKWSARSSRATTINTFNITFNGNTNAIYSRTGLQGNGATASSAQSSDLTFYPQAVQDAANATSNTFSSVEIYIPNYTASANKPFSSFSAQEDNISTAYILANAGLFRSTTAISSITIADTNSASIVSGSSFFLYGIKNS